jgi:hypothetical protein
MKPFDLIILDLDGTIIDLYKAGGASPAVRAAIAAVQQRGIPVTIGTGRTLAYIHAHLGYLGITTPVVSAMGAVIGDPQTGHVLFQRDLPLASTRAIAEWMEQHHILCGYYFCDEDGVFDIYQNRPGHLAADFYDHVLTTPRQIGVDVRPILAIGERAPIKFLAVSDPAEDGDIAPLLRARFGNEVTIVRTHPILVEGTAKGVDKGYGLHQLCHMLGIQPSRVLAIGDADNDIPMLEAAGMAVAMENAMPGVKAVADWIAPSLEEDGVAVALQRLAL